MEDMLSLTAAAINWSLLKINPYDFFEVHLMYKHSLNMQKLTSLYVVILFVALLSLAGCNDMAAVNAPGSPTTNVGPVQEMTQHSDESQPQSGNSVSDTIVQVSDQDYLADLYDRIVPSVVNIQVTGGNLPLPMAPEDFPFQFPDMPGQPDLPIQSEGTGWIYDESGHIVTNHHVVEGAESIVVIFHDGLWAEAEVVATDVQSDLAVLKVDPPEGAELNPLMLAGAEDLRVGYSVIAIGNPFGLESTMTTGIVSALGRSFPVGNALVGSYTLPAVIQTDAAINPGNSGGPLLNLNGEVVGVNFAIESPVRANSGVGFAIPVSIVKRIVPALIETGSYAYPYLGISGGSVTPQLAEVLDLPQNILGAYVDNVSPGGPADEAGLQGGQRTVEADGVNMKAGGDIIIAIDDAPVRSFDDLVSYLVRKTEPGQEATLTVLRNGDTMVFDVELGERPTTAVEFSELETEAAISAQAAIAIARDTVAQENLLGGPIVETIVTQDEMDGEPVWIVELHDADNVATIMLDAISGDVLNVDVE
jgi:S1-C subfamily serine protease